MKFISRYYIIATLLSVSVFLETLSYTYMQDEGQTYYYSSSILYALAGIAICILPLFHTKRDTSKTLPTGKYLPDVFYLFLLGLLIYHVAILAPRFQGWPPDKRLADMIPTIQLACKRFLSGQTVYGPAPEIRGGGIIPYLPTMWAPFLPAEFFGWDPRWATVGLLFLSLFICLIPVKKKSLPLLPTLIAGASLFLMFNYFLVKYSGFWEMIEEPVPAAFYVLLGFAILRKNYWLIGIAITCCLLSRFSLLFWVPVYLIYVFFAEPRSDFWKLFISIILSMLLLFILPFFIWNPLYFFLIPSTYGDAPHFWSAYGITDKLHNTVGFFKFFTVDQVGLMFKLEVITSALAPALFFALLAWLKKKYPLNARYIGYGSLKISILFFYGFLQLPYIYLFIVPTFMSYALLFEFLSAGDSPGIVQSPEHGY